MRVVEWEMKVISGWWYDQGTTAISDCGLCRVHGKHRYFVIPLLLTHYVGTLLYKTSCNLDRTKAGIE